MLLLKHREENKKQKDCPIGLDHSDDQTVKVICECVLNKISGNITFHLNDLLLTRRKLKFLYQPSPSTKKKRQNVFYHRTNCWISWNWKTVFITAFYHNDRTKTCSNARWKHAETQPRALKVIDEPNAQEKEKFLTDLRFSTYEGKKSPTNKNKGNK